MSISADEALLNTEYSNITFVAFDIETSGSYPLESEICEIAAVKWKGDQIIDQFQTLIQPRKKMSDFIIGIHGITNEMVQESPRIESKITEFHQFIQDAICIAHHSPFDMGFLSIEFEKNNLLPPMAPALCTSVLSQKLFPESVNHKLQTLIDFFKFPKNQAHRALDDSIQCMNVAKKCFEKVGSKASLKEIYEAQGKQIVWAHFYLSELKRNTTALNIIEAIPQNQEIRVLYRIGNQKRDERIKPFGLVRSPDGDFIFAYSEIEKKVRRYYLNRILETEVVR